MKNKIICKICGNDHNSFLFQNYDKNIRVSGKFDIFLCNKCKSIFIDPSLENYILKNYYPKNDYYSLKKIDTGKKSRMRIFLYKLYFSKNKSYFLKPLFLPLKFIMRGAILEKELKLLDVGSGGGQFVYEMKNLGLDAVGVEPSKFDKKNAKENSIKIYNKFLEETKFKDNEFNIITLNHVLEHTASPNKLLLEISRIIKPYGTFILGVPNTNSLAFKLFKKNWYQLDTPRHLINYSPYNLKIILNKCGFNIDKIRYNSRPSQFSISLMYALNLKSKKIELLLDLIFLPMTWIVNMLKCGDQIEVWCHKKNKSEDHKRY